ncbi:GH23939 [Drosophila grimshawi]|uniref:GH23939 n=1 Tax=Drosophila grimshawi TaxID=7222 RepID=B4JZT6_DROGR|nr:GH23939 [Drosophila grimshawi]
MVFYNNMYTYLHLYILVISVYATHGSGNFLNGRSHVDYGVQRNGDGGKLVKGEERTTNVNVGEVFVPKTFPLSAQEPTCEQLRAMWMIRMGARERARSPVFGRVVNREPIIPQRVAFEQRQRHLMDGSPSAGGQASRLYGAEVRPSGVGATTGTTSPRRSSQNRYVGVKHSNAGSSQNSNSVAVQGSFQKLKELIWTERAKELTQQRRAEELAARAAVLKEIANGQNIQSSYKVPFNREGDSLLMDENRSPDSGGNQYVNDERSIANIQNLDGNRNGNRGGGQRQHSGGHRASTRRIGSTPYGTGKGKMSKVDSRIRIPATESNLGDLSDRDRDQAVIGITRTYPNRQSHFRERNRSLLKQYSPIDYFQRNTRKLANLQYDQNQNLNLNENY